MRALTIFVLLTLILLTATPSVLSAQWVQTNGPYGGDVSSFAISGTKIFAGTYGGGVYLSTNNGTSWTAVDSGLTNLYVQDLAVSGTNLFAGTANGGVFLSTDNGTSWGPVNSGLTALNVGALASGGSGGLFAASIGHGVFRSTDDGAN